MLIYAGKIYKYMQINKQYRKGKKILKTTQKR